MYLKHLIFGQALKTISTTFNAKLRSNPTHFYQNALHRHLHAAGAAHLRPADSDDDAAEPSEFLSRFVWIMRKRIAESYPGLDKPTVDGMLRVIAERVSSEGDGGGEGAAEFSEDLWMTVREVSEAVSADMRRAGNKEKMRKFLQCEEVKEMTRFAVEAGVRGDMLREMRFKWAREKMEDSDFRQGIDGLRTVDNEQELELEQEEVEEVDSGDCVPKRRGKIRYKIYGLDLSEAKWGDVAERANKAGEAVWPEEAKVLSGKCKIVNDEILRLSEEDDPTPLFAEWIELLQPGRADWNVLLSGIRERNGRLYLKVAEHLLNEESFEPSVHDYSNLIDLHARESRYEDVERIIHKMTDKGIPGDLLIAAILIRMYCKSGNIDRAKEAFESVKENGFQPNFDIYNYMIMAYVNAGKPSEGEALVKEMHWKGVMPTYDIFFALLKSYSENGEAVKCEQLTTSGSVFFTDVKMGFEVHKLLLKAHAKAGDHTSTRKMFNYMMKTGETPDDECTADLISTYEKWNKLDKAVALVLELEKKPGFNIGVATYTALVDWLGKLQLVEEAEQLLGKISELGEAPPLKLHISLCDMYSRAGHEKKALQALGVVEARTDELGSSDFERVIKALEAGGFTTHASNMKKLTVARGFASAEQVEEQTLGS